jgi:hypothetical protein
VRKYPACVSRLQSRQETSATAAYRISRSGIRRNQPQRSLSCHTLIRRHHRLLLEARSGHPPSSSSSSLSSALMSAAWWSLCLEGIWVVLVLSDVRVGCPLKGSVRFLFTWRKNYGLNGLYQVTAAHECWANAHPSFGIRSVFIIYWRCDYGIY